METLSRMQGRIQRTGAEIDPALHACSSRVIAGKIQSGGRDVNANHGFEGPLPGEANGDGPGSCPKVQCPEAFPAAAALEHALDQLLGLGPGNEDGGVDSQKELTEGGASLDVLERLAAGPPGQADVVLLPFRIGERTLALEYGL